MAKRRGEAALGRRRGLAAAVAALLVCGLTLEAAADRPASVRVDDLVKGMRRVAPPMGRDLRLVKILVTGFEPFGWAPGNSSEDAARSLVGLEGEHFMVESRVLPVELGPAEDEIARLMKTLRPDAVVLFGQDGRTPSPTVWPAAHNEQKEVAAPDFEAPKPVDPNDPRAALRNSFEPRMFYLMQGNGVTIGRNDPGVNTCNAAYFKALELSQAMPAKPKVILVHLPFEDEQLAPFVAKYPEILTETGHQPKSRIEEEAARIVRAIAADLAQERALP